MLVLSLCIAACSTKPAKPSANDVMKQAYAQATKENKNVIIVFQSSTREWCKKFEASINDESVKKLIDDNYVVVYLDLMEDPNKKELENPGAIDILTKYQGEKAGLPFWVVADAKGTKLADSQIRSKGASVNTYGQNIGCPAADSEIAFLLNILQSTSKLSKDQLTLIGKRFAKNKQA
ncbi:hypothetical protein GCM10023149_45280 [Mucilaginibacter gynuensis]|uniref:Thioredoxin-like protein n=2 Tax=Mucilaginibacter gynuensis TaxID=1302236 RepID=A0ABP8H9Z2_9SPHI